MRYQRSEVGSGSQGRTERRPAAGFICRSRLRPRWIYTVYPAVSAAIGVQPGVRTVRAPRAHDAFLQHFVVVDEGEIIVLVPPSTIARPAFYAARAPRTPPRSPREPGRLNVPCGWRSDDDRERAGIGHAPPAPAGANALAIKYKASARVS